MAQDGCPRGAKYHAVAIIGGTERVRRTRAAWPWIMGLNGAMFTAQNLELGGRRLIENLLPTGGSIDEGEYWRPLTSLVVHPDGIVHLGVNTALLALVGPRAERELGTRRLLSVYVVAGFSTNALRYAVGGRTGGGASAAIFATAGAAASSWLCRDGRSATAITALTAGLVAAGLLIASITNDNHALAAGIGAACVGGLPDASQTTGLRHRLTAVGAIGLSAMVARGILS